MVRNMVTKEGGFEGEEGKFEVEEGEFEGEEGEFEVERETTMVAGGEEVLRSARVDGCGWREHR